MQSTNNYVAPVGCCRQRTLQANQPMHADGQGMYYRVCGDYDPPRVIPDNQSCDQWFLDEVGQPIRIPRQTHEREYPVFKIGTEITRDHPIHGDDPPKHDPSHDSRPLARDIEWSPAHGRYPVLPIVRAAKKFYPTHDDLTKAHNASWLRQARPVLANGQGTTISKAAFLEVLPHIPFAQARYVAAATADTPKWECLDYADAAKAWTLAVGIYPSGQVYDFAGGHSYSNVLVFNEAANAYEIVVYEPQANVVVPRAFPAHHYTGQGMVWYY